MKLMTEPDLHLFDSYEERLAALPKPRWCKCGHIEGTHFSEMYEGLQEFFAGDGRKEASWFTSEHGFKCHYGSGRKACKCTEFRPKKRKNLIKFYFTGRG
jgi:hypothetical protein